MKVLTETQKEVLIDCARMEKGENLPEDVNYRPITDGERTETRTMNSLTSRGLMTRTEIEGKPAYRLTERGLELAEKLES